MTIDRRAFLRHTTTGAAAALVVASAAEREAEAQAAEQMPAAIRALEPMTAGVVPVSEGERRQRVE